MMRLRRVPLLLLALLPLASCGGETPATTPPVVPPAENDLSWVRANTIPFRTDVADDDFSDLMPLKAVIGNARIVALGEATHGSAEFFRMKHRLLRFLVQEMGFNTFAIEASWAESYDVDRYVHGGPGDPGALLQGLYFWTWNTQEVADMLTWMRAYNRSPGAAGPVSFGGFDMQFSRRAMDEVEAYLRTADPVAADSAASRYACFRKYQDNTQGVEPNYTIAPPAVRDECRRGVTAVWTALSEARGRYAAAGFGAGYERALRGARVVQQNEEQRGSTQSTGLRDRAMAENAAWLLQQAGPSAKMVVWAHNFHVSHDAGAMGNVLSTQFGSGMVNVGFLFGHGGFNAVEQDASGISVALRALSADRASAGTYEYELQRLGLPRMILDLRSVPAGGATAWLQGPRLMREIGAVYSPSQPSRFFQQVNLPQRFDVVIWFDEVHPSTLLPFD